MRREGAFVDRAALVLGSLLAGSATLAGACSLTTSLDGLSSGSSSSGGDEGGSGDGGLLDAPSSEGGPTPSGPVPIFSLASGSRSTGLPMQGHVVFAERSGRWVAFAFDGSSRKRIATRTSSNFVTWIDGPGIDLPRDHDGDGRNLAVAARALADSDVIHLSAALADGTDRRYYGLRGRVTAQALDFAPPTEITRTTISDGQLAPDGAAIGISSTGFVTHFTGWSMGVDDTKPNEGTGNAYALRSSVPDLGAEFLPTWQKSYIEIVPVICNARGVVAVGGGDLLAFFEKGDEDPRPTNLRWTRGSVSWSPPADVFEGRRSFDPSDWSALALSDSDVHAVRLRQDGNVDHRRWNGSTWQPGAVLPTESLSTGAGVALVRGVAPGTVVLYGISGGSAVREATWTGAAWSAWTTRVPAGPSRTSLVATDANAHAAIAWTEAAASTFSVAGMRVR